MAKLTIRYLDDELECRLRIRAAEHGRSMEEEVLEILRKAVTPSVPKDLGCAIHERFAAIGGELELPPRDAMRRSPFSWSQHR